MATTASLSGYSAFFSSGLLAPPRTDLAPASPSAFLKSEPSTPRSESDVDMDRETTPTPALRASTSSNSSSGTVRRRRSSLSLSVSTAPAQIKAPVAPQRTRAGSVAADKTGATRAGRARSGSMGIVLRPRRSMRPVSLALNHAKPPPSVPLPPLPSPGCKLALSTIEASPRTAPPTQERFNIPPSSPVDPFLAERRPLAQYSENCSQPLKA